MNLFTKLHGGLQESTHDSNRNKVTAKQFLGIDSGKSYSDPEKWLNYCQSLREAEVKQLEQLFRCYNQDLRITNSSTPKQDKGGRNYSFVSFNKPKGTIGLKLILEAGMEELLVDYIDGKASIAFTLDELVDEAMGH